MRSKLFVAALFLAAFFSFGQTKIEDIQVSNTKAVFLGKTERVDKLRKVSATSEEKLSKSKSKKAQPNFFGRGNNKSKIKELEHLGPDPIRQTEISSLRSRVIIEPIVNIEGLTNGSNPQDPTGAIGSNYYLQAINATEIGIFQKNGTLVQSFSGNTLWNPIGESSLGDPIILFDQAADRWLITEFADPANLLVAMSETNDPRGSYFVYSFATPDFPDYPKYAIWSDSYTVTTNESSTNALHQYFIDRDALIAGEEVVTIQRVEVNGNTNTEAGFYVTTPIDWNGATAPVDNKPMVVKINDSSWGQVAEDVLEIYTFDVDFANPSNTSTTLTSIVTTPFDGYPCAATGAGFACVPQKDGGGLDAIPEVVMNVPHYRNFGTHESIVLNFITDATNGENVSGIRWMELRRSGGNWMLYQEGTFAPDDGLHRFMGSIAMDGNGNIGLAYNVSSEDEYVGIRFTGRFANDPPGVMTVQEHEVVAGLNPINSGTRFGDYAQMNVDPSDDMTFWYTSEYAGNGINDATTRIFSFQLERKDNDLSAIKVISPATYSTLTSPAPVTVEINNTGNLAASNFDIQLVVNEVPIVTDTYSGTLDPQNKLEHTFSQVVDFSTLGEYDIMFSIIYGSDESLENNSHNEIIYSVAGNDASVSATSIDELCIDNVEVDIEITNEGGITLESADIEVYLNEVLEETINWTGSLETGESASESVSLSGLNGGSNSISVVVSNPNEATDEVPDDNTALLNVTLAEGMDQVTLIINADEYPDETTWELLDDAENVVASGGPYDPSQAETTIEEVLCVDPNACYEFVIYDAYDDGICCQYGNGSYAMEDGDGITIFASDGQFGTSETTAFCLGTECNLTAEIDVVNESTDESGSIVITASGSYDYEYSIDGGSLFQESPVFDGLVKGTYDVYIQSQGGNCIFEESVDVDFDCDLSITVTQEKNADGTGNIEIFAEGGDTYEYSIDGGVSFQQSESFSNLPSGVYEIQVVSNSGECVVEETFEFDFVLGTSLEHEIIIAPNPTDGVFKISVHGQDHIRGFLEVEVLDLNGRVIQNHRFNRYDKAFEGTISLYAYPNGIYFLKLRNAETDRLVKIIKQ